MGGAAGMDVSFLLRGLLIGFAIAAPVGPIGILCIQRTLAKGRIYGFASGLGAATADAIYGAVAGFGLTFISDVLINQQLWLRLLGGAFLLYLGTRTILSKPSKETPQTANKGLAADYTSTFLLTLTNPMTILSFIAVFAGLGLGSAGGDYALAALFVVGVFAGSTLWWLILSGTVGALRSRLNAGRLRLVNVLSGVVIIGFAAVILAGLIGLNF